MSEALSLEVRRANLIGAFRDNLANLAEVLANKGYNQQALRLVANYLTPIVECIATDANNHRLSTSCDPSTMLAATYSDPRRSERRLRTSLFRYVAELGENIPASTGMRGNSVAEDAINSYVQHVLADTVARNGFEHGDIKIVDGPEIVRAYELGYGYSSCMCGGGGRNKLLWLYRDNPERIQMALCHDAESNKGFARALLWKTDEGPVVMDRVYPNNGTASVLMRIWARNRGFVYRVGDSAPTGHPPQILVDGKVYQVTLKAPSRVDFPYLDTFSWGTHSRATDQLVVSNTDTCKSKKHIWSFFSQGGAPNWLVRPAYGICAICGEALNRPGDFVEAIGPNGAVKICVACGKDRTTRCEGCENLAFTASMFTQTVLKGRVRTESKVCRNCHQHAWTCVSCNTVYSGSVKQAWHNPNGRAYCPLCVNTCKKCGKAVGRGNVLWNARLEMCLGCATSTTSESSEEDFLNG